MRTSCLASLVAFVAVSAVASIRPALAQTMIRVNSRSDVDGFDIGYCRWQPGCTLRSALRVVESDPFGYYVIELVHGRYDVYSPLRLRKGAASLIPADRSPGNEGRLGDVVFSGGDRTRVFAIEPAGEDWAYLAMDRLVVERGFANAGSDKDLQGAGIFVTGTAWVDVMRSLVRENRASTFGSGIAAGPGANLYVNNTIVRDNVSLSFQNGICGGGQTSTGAGISSRGANTYIASSAIIGNRSCRGAGLFVAGGSFSMENSTVALNEAGKRGGGILLNGPQNSVLRFNTIADNAAGTRIETVLPESRYGGGVALAGVTGTVQAIGNVFARNSVTFPLFLDASGNPVSLSTKGLDCHVDGGSPGVDSYHNFLGSRGNCGTLFTSSYAGTDSRLLDPQMDLLANHDTVPVYEPTLGMLPHPGGRLNGRFYNSPTRGYPYVCNTWDQRFHQRPNASPSNGTCDIGAMELGGVVP